MFFSLLLASVCQGPELAERFRYDAAKPLDVQETAVSERDGVLMAGIPDIASIWVRGTEPGFLEYKKTMPPGKLERFVDTVAPLDAIHYVGRAAPTPLLMQFARLERNFGLADMQRYAAAAS